MISTRTRLIAVLIAVLAFPVAGSAQLSAQDSVRAQNQGRAAAKQELVALYGMAGFVAAPVALGSALLVTGGDTKPLPFAAGIIGAGWLLGQASAAPKKLPRPVELTLEAESAEFKAAFLQSYARTLRARRAKAAMIGAILGVMAGGILAVSAIPTT